METQQLAPLPHTVPPGLGVWISPLCHVCQVCFFSLCFVGSSIYYCFQIANIVLQGVIVCTLVSYDGVPLQVDPYLVPYVSWETTEYTEYSKLGGKWMNIFLIIKKQPNFSYTVNSYTFCLKYSGNNAHWN